MFEVDLNFTYFVLNRSYIFGDATSLNTEKTEYMIIGSHQKLRSIETEPAIYLGADKIKRVKSTKSLGLMLDETLSWNEQINAITNGKL